MIISHRHKFIFAAIPKTGTHSVRRALRAHMSAEDLEQVGLFVQKAFPFEELAAIKHGHIRLSQIRPFVGETAFASYLKFAFVRHPLDRFVSYCSFMTRDTGAFAKDPEAVMHYFLDHPPLQHILFAPQYVFVTDADGRLLADVIGRVEDMQASYDAIAARLGLPSAVLEHANSSERGDYRTYYTPVLIERVTALYQRDFELFGYSV